VVARDHGATVTVALLVDGEAAEALIETAADRDADLVVIGARQDITLAERLLGTVATEVVRRAPCEVLIVRPRAYPERLRVPETDQCAGSCPRGRSFERRNGSRPSPTAWGRIADRCTSPF